jgi:hypothetical protein
MNKKFEGYKLISKKGTEIRTLAEGDVVLTRGQIEASKIYNQKLKEWELKQKRSEQKRGTDYVKSLLTDEFKSLIGGNESGHALELAVRISFQEGPNGGFLIMNGINSKKKATFGDMCKIFGIHKGEKIAPKNASNIIKKFEEKGFLFVTRPNSTRSKGTNYTRDIENSIYEINPKFFAKGKTAAIKFVKIYLKNFRILTQGLSPAEKGFLLNIIPFFHYDQYVLCENPNEKNIDNLIYFTRKGLAKQLKTTRENATKKIKKLKDAGILGEFDSKGTMALYIHPDLIFKKDIEFEDVGYTDLVRDLFLINSNKAKQEKFI